MNKLFNFAQTKGKWHKFLSFNLGGGAKLYKNFAQKLLAVSLCMAMVLLGVPRGQNFVAEATDEATKSVALLTLTLTGKEDEPLEANMEWKSFVQGTTVDLEVVFAADGITASEPLDYGTWLDTYGSMDPSDARFVPFAPAAWLEALPSGEMAGDLFGDGWSPDLLPYPRALLATCDWFSPLTVVFDSYGAPAFPGLARVALGSSLSVAPHPSLASLTGVTSVTYVAEVKDSSVVSFDSDSSSIVGVGVGTTTISLSCAYSVGNQQYPLMPLGALDVEVYDPAVSVTGVTLSEPTKSLKVGESFDLTATVTPGNATDQALTWTVDNYDAAGFVNDAGQVVASLTTAAGSSQSVTVKGLEAGSATISAKTSDGSNITATCVVTVTEASTGPSYLEATVDVKGQQQRLRVYDPNGVLPEDTTLSAEAVTAHEHLDDDHEIEHLLSYNISLLDAAGDALPMPLSDKVELCFEVLDGLDKDELEVVLVQEFDDAEFEENLVDLDGASWVKVKTDHFSPYVLIDKLSPEEKGVQVQDDPGPKNNAKTGDLATQITVAGLGMTLVLALGIMLRLITSKRKFEE